MTIDRLFISHQYIRGKGIEIGAWHNPFPVNPLMQVTYVDRYPYEKLIEMRDKDPTIAGKQISRVDVVDDGMWLKKFEDESQDFVLSSHQLEHCWNPLGTILRHGEKLKTGGKAFYAIPDKRFSFDKDRLVSSLGNIQALESGTNSDGILRHQYREYLIFVDKMDPMKADELSKKIDGDHLLEKDIHWFCWDSTSLIKMFTLSIVAEIFEIDLFSRAGHENFVVLRKL